MKVLILGAGYTGARVATAARHASMAVVATRRTDAGCARLGELAVPCVRFDRDHGAALRDCFVGVSHIVVSVPPARQAPLSDPAHAALDPLLQAGSPTLRHIIYFSTIGVYGDHGGSWVDETTPCGSRQMRSVLRQQAEMAWRALAQSCAVPLSVFRLSGIYGPGRNALCNAVNGTSRILIKPGQVFNRVHVDDIVTATLLAMRVEHDGILNITDDEPAPPEDVVRFAHTLLGIPPPEPIDFAQAELSPMARSFYSESKRVRNARSRRELGLDYAFPSYREGLEALWRNKQG